MSAHILVINDDDDILALFQLILQEDHYRVTTSHIAYENVTDIERIDPDLLIIDLKIGSQAAGWEMLQKLRMYPPTSQIPIILCTAAIKEVREQEDILRQKGIPVIYKPFDIEELLHVVRQTLRFFQTMKSIVKVTQDKGS